jgi:integrase
MVEEEIRYRVTMVLLNASYAMVAVLLGCALRRAELAGLTVDELKQREDHWVIADLTGKGAHVRTMPLPSWVKRAVDAWRDAEGAVSGPVFRTIKKVWEIAER